MAVCVRLCYSAPHWSFFPFIALLLPLFILQAISCRPPPFQTSPSPVRLSRDPNILERLDQLGVVILRG